MTSASSATARFTFGINLFVVWLRKIFVLTDLVFWYDYNTSDICKFILINNHIWHKGPSPMPHCHNCKNRLIVLMEEQDVKVQHSENSQQINRVCYKDSQLSCNVAPILKEINKELQLISNKDIALVPALMALIILLQTDRQQVWSHFTKAFIPRPNFYPKVGKLMLKCNQSLSLKHLSRLNLAWLNKYCQQFQEIQFPI